MNEPERPGKIIPLTLIIPHKKTKIKLSFSFAGSNKLIINPTLTPTRTNKRLLLDLKLTNFLRWIIVPITNPKKRLQTYISNLSRNISRIFEVEK